MYLNLPEVTWAGLNFFIHTKFPQLKLIHSYVYTVHRHAVSICKLPFVFLSLCYLISNCCFLTLFEGFGWQYDRHGPSPSTSPVTLVYIDQLFCHCVLIYYNVHGQSFFLLRYDSLLLFLFIKSINEQGQNRGRAAKSMYFSNKWNVIQLPKTRSPHPTLIVGIEKHFTTFFFTCAKGTSRSCS